MGGKQFFVYIMTNKKDGVLYVGVTNDITRRVNEHCSGFGSRFTKKYGLDKLVYFEIYTDPMSAIAREKQLKAGPRRKKISLIKDFNPEWRDLSQAT